MSSRRALALPTAAALSGALRVPATNPALPKILMHLTRSALLKVVQQWLQTRNQATCGPVLGVDDSAADSPYDTAQTLEELREVYEDLGARRGGKREVVDRILEGDWRHGLSLRQLAMVDVQVLLDHPTSQRWTARRLEKIVATEDDRDYKVVELDSSDELPRLQGQVFVRKLQQAIGSIVKAHYYLTRLEPLAISLLRIQILDSPYNTQSSMDSQDFFKGNEILFVAFPDHCPFVYLSAANGRAVQGTSSAPELRKIVVDTIARALSRPQKRLALKTTNLNSRSLSAMVFLQGPHGSSNALGGWSIFVEGSVEESPLVSATGIELDPHTEEDRTTRKRASLDHEEDTSAVVLRKRRRAVAEKRFGKTGLAGDGHGVERFDVRLENAFTIPPRKVLGQRDDNVASRAPGPPKQSQSSRDEVSNTDSNEWRPRISICFHGSHVFAGVREMVETGAINGIRMPGWMTGEHAVSAGVVRDGLLKKRRRM